jgi:3',5'-cyclic AMP phosphodiesterase CpdA
VKLLAISDLHVGHRANRDALDSVPEHPDDWLMVAGDVGERPEHLVTALEILTRRFARVIWTPGNHDLWCPANDTVRTRGQARYDELVSICRDFRVLTPEDPYAVWPGDGITLIVPMFLLFDYSFRPSDVANKDAVAWARASGIVSSDELLLRTDPWPSHAAWCDARVETTRARLEAIDAGRPTILVNHWPLRYDLAVPPRVPQFSLWCGTTQTESWAARYRARAVISGHLHLRTTLWREGVRYDEVSLVVLVPAAGVARGRPRTRPLHSAARSVSTPVPYQSTPRVRYIAATRMRNTVTDPTRSAKSSSCRRTNSTP